MASAAPFFGWVSDHIGRENTMFIAFLIEGIGIYALLQFAADPLLFVILSGLVFFAWGEIYSLFPATCTDIFGTKFATTNYGMLYTAKGRRRFLVPLGNVLMTMRPAKLERGLYRCRSPQHHCRRHGSRRPAAAAYQADGQS